MTFAPTPRRRPRSICSSLARSVWQLLAILLVSVDLFGCQESTVDQNESALQQTDDSNDQTENLSKAVNSSAQSDKTDSFTHVVSADAEYYKGGPQQAQPPDGTFASGTKVKMIEDAGSYSLVRSQDGTEAYVASASLKQIGGSGSK